MIGKMLNELFFVLNYCNPKDRGMVYTFLLRNSKLMVL